MKLRRAWSLTLVLLTFASVAVADIGSLSPEEDTADLVLERADWAGFFPLSLEELLRHFAGITLARRGGLGSPQYSNVLGSITGHIQVVLDGVEMNEVDLNWSRFFGIPVSHIDKIMVHRTSDPVRVEIWTRKSAQSKPITDLDVARGDYETRTRRIRFVTPERAVQASINYEELLRGQQDFRVRPETAPLANLGSYAGRGRFIDGLLIRPNEDQVRFRHFDFVDDSNGSYLSQSDYTHTRRILNGVRWSTSLAGHGLDLDVSQLVWDRTQRNLSVVTQLTESRNSIAADLMLLESSQLSLKTLLRASDASTFPNPGVDSLLSRARQWDAGVHLVAGEQVRWQGWLAFHDNRLHGSSWSGRVRGSLAGQLWRASAEVGRGVSFAGTVTSGPAAESPLSHGLYASAGVSRQGSRLSFGLRGWGKDFDGRSQVTQELFPLLGTGPKRLGGALAHANWNGVRGNWLYGLGMKLAWTPWVEGDRGGLPLLQAEVLARLARLDWFEGDLSVTLQAVWHAETDREFTNELPALAAYHETGFDINVRMLRRIVFFWHVANAYDLLYETHPDVLMPALRSHFGLQVLLFD